MSAAARFFRLSPTFPALVAALTLLVVAPPLPAHAQDLAVGGVDAVSMRDSERAVPGRHEFATHWKGREWLFTNESNRAVFEADPRAYAPAMGGFCPVAMAEGRKERGDPGQFVVLADRIYLTSNPSARRALERDAGRILPQAQANWKRMAR